MSILSFLTKLTWIKSLSLCVKSSLNISDLLVLSHTCRPISESDFVAVILSCWLYADILVGWWHPWSLPWKSDEWSFTRSGCIANLPHRSPRDPFTVFLLWKGVHARRMIKFAPMSMRSAGADKSLVCWRQWNWALGHAWCSWSRLQNRAWQPPSHTCSVSRLIRNLRAAWTAPSCGWSVWLLSLITCLLNDIFGCQSF